MLNDRTIYHIVQIGSDDSVFSLGIKAEYTQRQITYGKYLDQLHKGSKISSIILTKNKKAKTIQIDNTTFIPLITELRSWHKFKAWHTLYEILKKIDREQRIHLVTTQTIHDESWIALLFARTHNCPIIGQIHYDIFSPHIKEAAAQKFLGKFRFIITMSFMQYFTGIRVVGQNIYQEILKRNLHKCVRVIPVSMSMLATDQSHRTRQKENKVLFVGRLAKEKNLGTWLEIANLVLQKVPEAKFEIVGDGVLREELSRLIERKSLTDKVNLTGFVNYDELIEIYQSSCIFLITSLYEGFGRVVAEALANQIPVVAPRITGIEDIVVHCRSGFLHESHDISGIADNVITLLRNPSLAQEMGAWGEKFVKQKFAPEVLAKDWIQMWVDTINNGGEI